MKYTVLGAGAMGLRFGILLQEQGNDVDFVDTWKDNVETIRKQKGVYVTRNNENKRLININIYYPEEYHGNPDVIIPFTKQMQLSEMLKRSAHFFNKNQYVITFMNGMGHISKINQYFDKDKVLAGTALIGSNLVKAGFDNFTGEKGKGSVNIANQTEKPDEMTKKIVDNFKQAQFNPTLTNNFKGTLMTKVVLNSVFNTICTMYRIPIGKFINSPSVEQLSKQLLNEAYDVCERSGINLLNTRKKQWEIMYNVGKYSVPNHYPSMYQDLVKHRPTEVDYINGYIYDLGLKYNYIASTHNFLRHLVHLSEFTDQQEVAETSNNTK